MRLFCHVLFAISLGFLAASVNASPANPENGVDYRALEQALPTDSGKKIEVIEFFWYSCPHCASFDSVLTAWVKKQGDKIAFKQVPVAFRDFFVLQQKLFYALEAMEKTSEINPKIFQAIHVERQRLDTDKAVLEFIDKQKLDKQKFLDLYHSFGVQTKARRAAQLQEAYKIDGVPMIAIGGHYLTSPAIAGATLANQPESMLQAAALQVMDHLIDKVLAEKKKGKDVAPVTSKAKK